MRFLCFLFLPVIATPALAQLSPAAQMTREYSHRTVVLYNSSLKKSRELAQYYAKRRSIPLTNLVGLECSEAETISREEYEKTINAPLQKEFDKREWWKLEKKPDGRVCTQVVPRIFAIMQGLPLRIDEQAVLGDPDPKTGERPVVPPAAGQSNAASVDSELMLFGMPDHPIAGPLKNPYFDQKNHFITQSLAPLFLVGRIDGPDEATARRLIDDAISVEATGLLGRAYIDLARKDGAYQEGEDWLTASAKTLGLSGFPLFVDSRAERFPENYPMTDCAVYFGWYTMPPDGPFLNPNFHFKRGAVACHLHSFSATTLKNPNDIWVGILLSKGACATWGNVYEPFLSLTVHFDKLIDRLLRGFTLAEATSMATPGASWMAISLGDPLYRPFAADLDQEKSDGDYRLIRTTMRDNPIAQEGGKPLRDALLKAASDRKSGILYETLAQITQGSSPDDSESISSYYQSAADAFADPADKIRVTQHYAEYLITDNKKSEALKIVKSAMATYGKLPEAKSLATRLAEWQAQ